MSTDRSTGCAESGSGPERRACVVACGSTRLPQTRAQKAVCSQLVQCGATALAVDMGMRSAARVVLLVALEPRPGVGRPHWLSWVEQTGVVANLRSASKGAGGSASRDALVLFSGVETSSVITASRTSSPIVRGRFCSRRSFCSRQSQGSICEYYRQRSPRERMQALLSAAVPVGLGVIFGVWPLGGFQEAQIGDRHGDVGHPLRLR
jgi:hypothetical protein